MRRGDRVIAVFGRAFLTRRSAIRRVLPVTPSTRRSAARYAAAGRGAERLPSRLSLAAGPGDRFALIAEASRYLVNARHDDRDQRSGADLSLGPGSAVRVMV